MKSVPHGQSLVVILCFAADVHPSAQTGKYLSPGRAASVPDGEVVELGLETLDVCVRKLEVCVEAVAFLDELRRNMGYKSCIQHQER